MTGTQKTTGKNEALSLKGKTGYDLKDLGTRLPFQISAYFYKKLLPSGQISQHQNPRWGLELRETNQKIL